MSAIGINHVQVSVPTTALTQAREFHLGFIGLKEIARPVTFTMKGIWSGCGGFFLTC